MTGITSISASIFSSTMTSDKAIVMHTVGLKEAEGRLAELIDEVANGEEVVLTREDGTTFKIVCIALMAPYPKFGSAKGLMKMAKDFDEPLADFQAYTL
jgi:antitoxin (DNA-binding transcriptional repressor) of toxin-antitoxin stability system